MSNELDRLNYEVTMVEAKLKLAKLYYELSTFTPANIEKGKQISRYIVDITRDNSDKRSESENNAPVIQGTEERLPEPITEQSDPAKTQVHSLSKVSLQHDLNNMTLEEYYKRGRAWRPYFCYPMGTEDPTVLTSRIDFYHATVDEWNKTIKKVMRNDGGGGNALKAFTEAAEKRIETGIHVSSPLLKSTQRRAQTVSTKKICKYLTYVFGLFGKEGSLEGPVFWSELREVLPAILSEEERDEFGKESFLYHAKVRGKEKEYLRVCPLFIAKVENKLAEALGILRMQKNLKMTAPAQSGYSVPKICKDYTKWKKIYLYKLEGYTWAIAPLSHLKGDDGERVPVKNTDGNVMMYPIPDGDIHLTRKAADKAAVEYAKYSHQLGEAFDDADFARIYIHDTTDKDGKFMYHFDIRLNKQKRLL